MLYIDPEFGPLVEFKRRRRKFTPGTMVRMQDGRTWSIRPPRVATEESEEPDGRVLVPGSLDFGPCESPEEAERLADAWNTLGRQLAADDDALIERGLAGIGCEFMRGRVLPEERGTIAFWGFVLRHAELPLLANYRLSLEDLDVLLTRRLDSSPAEHGRWLIALHEQIVASVDREILRIAKSNAL